MMGGERKREGELGRGAEGFLWVHKPGDGSVRQERIAGLIGSSTPVGGPIHKHGTELAG
jgi:hypothetical protein